MSVINLADKYEAMGLRRLSELQPELDAAVIRRGYKRWPTG